jgi:hypothetical protein
MHGELDVHVREQAGDLLLFDNALQLGRVLLLRVIPGPGG